MSASLFAYGVGVAFTGTFVILSIWHRCRPSFQPTQLDDLPETGMSRRTELLIQLNIIADGLERARRQEDWPLATALAKSFAQVCRELELEEKTNETD